MNSLLQIKTLLFSFSFGSLFFFLSKYNLLLIKNMKIINRYLVTIVFVVDSVLLYVFWLYKINHGYFHIYFFLMFILGFWLTFSLYPKLLTKFKEIFKKVNKK